MKICKITSVSAHCTGYGKRRLEISALIPITTNRQVDRSLKMLMPKIPPVKKRHLHRKSRPWQIYNDTAHMHVYTHHIRKRSALLFPNWKKRNNHTCYTNYHTIAVARDSQGGGSVHNINRL